MNEFQQNDDEEEVTVKLQSFAHDWFSSIS